MVLHPAMCFRAVLARDARHDGRFFTCVKTTGIYCRPICPARPPKLANCSFVPTAAAAQEAGFRPCLRCRPESSPDLDAWRGTSATVSRALKMIEVGALDGDDLASLADRLEIGERHLRRLFRQHIGAAPVTVAQTRRVLLAKQLIHQTNLSMIQIALASGFGSVRRFNETFQNLYQRPPSQLRRLASDTDSLAPDTALLLPYRPPYDWDAMIAFLRRRAIPGVEVVTSDSYSRVIELSGVAGSIVVTHEPEQSALRVVVRFSKLTEFSTIITRVRRMFDLSADPGAIAAALSSDPMLSPLVKVRPGLRVPGGWDGFEIAVRAVLGQQISLKSATQLVGQIASDLGRPVAESVDLPGLTHAFPQPDRFSATALANFRIPKSRIDTLINIANAAANDARLFDPRRDLDEAITHLRKLPGVGEWTAQYIAMRALGETDAFLAGDVAIRRQLALRDAGKTPSQILARADRWRPWRAYAVMHLWTADSEGEKRLQSKETDHAITT